MKKIIREVSSDQKTIQITTADERWYVREGTNPETGLPGYDYVPSVTWIAGFYPKGIQFYKWLAEKGWDESQAIKQAAGDKGSKVHKAIEALLTGNVVNMDSKFTSPSTEQDEELTVEEYEAVLSFASWWKSFASEHKVEIVSTETTVWNEEYGYAGTVDLLLLVDDSKYLIVDFKTSASVWTEYELQLSAYKHALSLDKPVELMILQVGYKRNKAGYKDNEIEDKFELFLTARQIWKNETDGQVPKQKDYPLSVSIYEELKGTDEGSEDSAEAPAGDKKTGRRGRSNRTA